METAVITVAAPITTYHHLPYTLNCSCWVRFILYVSSLSSLSSTSIMLGSTASQSSKYGVKSLSICNYLLLNNLIYARILCGQQSVSEGRALPTMPIKFRLIQHIKDIIPITKRFWSSDRISVFTRYL